MPPKFKPRKPKPRKPYTLERKVGIKRVAEEEAQRPKGTKIGKGPDVQSIENVLALEATQINPATIPETTTLPEWTGNMGSSMEEAWGAYDTEFKSTKKVEPVPSYEPPPTKLEKPDWTGRSGMPQEYPVGAEKYPQKKFELRPEKAKKQDADAYVKDATPFEQQPMERTRATRRDYLSRAKLDTRQSDDLSERPDAKIQPLRGNKKVDTDWMMASEQRNMTNQEIVHFSDQGMSQREYLAQREVRPLRLGMDGPLNVPKEGEQPRDELGRYTNVPSWAGGVGFDTSQTESYRDEIRRKSTQEKTILDREGTLQATLEGTYRKNPRDEYHYAHDYAPLPDMDMSLMPIDHDKLNAVGKKDRRRFKSDEQVLAEERAYAENYQEPIKVQKEKRTHTHSGIPIEGKGYEYEGMPPTFDEEPMESISARVADMSFEPEPEPDPEEITAGMGALSLIPADFDDQEITDAMDAMAITSAPEGVPFAEVIAEDERLKRLAKQEASKGEVVAKISKKQSRERKRLIDQLKVGNPTDVERIQIQQRINELSGSGWGKGDYTEKAQRELAGQQEATFLPQKHTIKFRGITQGGEDITDEMGQIVSRRPLSPGELAIQEYKYNQGGGTTGAPREVRKYEKKPSWAGRFNPTKKHKEWRPEDIDEPVEEEEEAPPPRPAPTEAEDKLYGNYDEWEISTDEEQEPEGEDVVEAVQDIPVKASALDMNWADAVDTRPTQRSEQKTMMDFMPKGGFEGPTPLHEDPTRELTRAEIRAGERWQSYAEKEGFEYRAGASRPWRELGEKEKKIDKLPSAGGASMEGWNLQVAGPFSEASTGKSEGASLKADREGATGKAKTELKVEGIHKKTPFPAYATTTTGYRPGVRIHPEGWGQEIGSRELQMNPMDEREFKDRWQLYHNLKK